MNCPACGAPMAGHSFEARLGRSVSIDLCPECQFLWFDQAESIQLSPASTLKLFRTIGEQAASGRRPPPPAMACPRCAAPLGLAHDRQRNTAFQYWRCPAGHGRLTSFFDFLREKDFIRPLSREQLDELRRSVGAVNCSNCGAPIDLAAGSSCAHCGSPPSMLDLRQAGRLVAQLQEADRGAAAVDPMLPLEMERARRNVEATFAAFERDPEWTLDVGAGLAALARWLGRSVR
jgi:ssDNA-binding Zn-finger/Zn-ribbon topoisomerase 1